MTIKSLNVSFFFTFIFVLNARAQQFGGNDPYTHWKQIKTKPVRIIFPKGDDSVAIRIVDIINYLDTNTISSIGNKRRKINLVLQDQTTISNAYVGLGPFRSEFFLTPVQNSFEQGSIPWPDQLASHEYRHVQQYSNFNVGVSKFLGSLFGQEGQALANDGAIPNWFFEGDAVYNETNVSQQGRGRLPYFFKDYRSLFLAGKEYSYMKLRNGSYKDFTPDHYALGYLLVAYGYQKFGNNFWLKVTHDAASYKGLFYPFQKAIQKYAGVSFTNFRLDAFIFFKAQLINSSLKFNKVDGQYSNFQYPQIQNNDALIYVKSTFKNIPAFYIKENNIERKIRTKDVSIDNYFSYKNDKIIYAAFQPDIRWGYKDYSNLKLLDIKTGKQQTITNHSKYFSPDLNGNASQAIAVRVTSQGNSVLDIIDINDHSVKEFPNPNHYFYTYPKFVNDKLVTVAVRNQEGKMAITLLNIVDGSERILTPFTFNVIAFPFIKNDTIYFSSSYKSNDKLMAVALANKNLFELAISDQSISNGFYQPSLSNTKLVWTTFTNKGFKLKETEIKNITFTLVSDEEYTKSTSDFGITTVNSNKDILSNVPHQNYSSVIYHKATHIFNFHSIEPDVNDPVYTLNIIGQNILNTLQSQISLSYDRNEGYKKGAFSLIYAGLFPYLSGGISYTIDRSALLQNKIIHWNNAELYGGINVPLNLSRGRSYTYINIGSQYTYNQSVFQAGIAPHQIAYSYIDNYFSISNQCQQARQNIYPRYAQSLNLKFQNAVTRFSGHQFVANANLYLPGVITNHNLILNAALLFQDTSHQIGFSSSFPFSRGYSAFNFHQMFKLGINYSLPLMYPDAGFANLVYFSRIRTNVFFDDTRVMDYYTNHSQFNRSFRSTGAELFFDTKWFNQAPITFGLRFTHLLDSDIYSAHSSNRIDILLPLNIFHN